MKKVTVRARATIRHTRRHVIMTTHVSSGPRSKTIRKIVRVPR